MKEPKDEDIFNLFRSKLTYTDHMSADIDANWSGMDDLLEGKARKKNIVVWLYRISAGIAALLILGLGFELINLEQPAFKKTAKVIMHDSVLPLVPAKKVPGFEKRALMTGKVTPKQRLPVTFFKETTKRPLSSSAAAASILAVKIQRHYDHDSLILETTGLPNINFQNRPIDYVNDRLILAGVAVDSTKNKNTIANNKNTKKTITDVGPRLALAVMAAPDVNGVNSLTGGRAGTNFALQLSLKLTKRLSISTGAAYVVMPYQTNFGSYRSTDIGWWHRMFSTNGKPNDVVANCEVLDIPLNINYQLFNKGRNSLAVGTGLSSYFMLQENYRFNFADPTVGSTNIDLNNQNRHLLGVLNLNATYQRQVSNNLGIVLQPYVKLPLTHIGFGEVNLKSAGIAVGFSWNISPF